MLTPMLLFSPLLARFLLRFVAHFVFPCPCPLRPALLALLAICTYGYLFPRLLARPPFVPHPPFAPSAPAPPAVCTPGRLHPGCSHPLLPAPPACTPAVTALSSAEQMPASRPGLCPGSTGCARHPCHGRSPPGGAVAHTPLGATMKHHPNAQTSLLGTARADLGG